MTLDTAGVGPAAPLDPIATALLAAAHDLLGGEGAGALTVRRLAAAAGVSTINVYSRFGGKDGVIDELFIDGFHRLGRAMSALAATDDPLGDLRRCATTYRRFALENPTYYALMFGSAVPGYEPSERAEQVGMWALGRVIERVQRAIDAGVISSERDPAVVAAALWACEHGLVSLELGGPGRKPGRFDWDAITAVGIDAITRGLTGPP